MKEFISLIIESYTDLWEESKVRFFLVVLPSVLSIISIIMTLSHLQ